MGSVLAKLDVGEYARRIVVIVVAPMRYTQYKLKSCEGMRRIRPMDVEARTVAARWLLRRETPEARLASIVSRPAISRRNDRISASSPVGPRREPMTLPTRPLPLA